MIIEERLTSIDLFNFDGTIEEAKEFLDNLKSEYSKYTNLRLDYESGYDGGNLDLYGSREETQKEIADRELKLQKVLEKVRENKLKQYNDLKKELGL